MALSYCKSSFAGLMKCVPVIVVLVFSFYWQQVSTLVTLALVSVSRFVTGVCTQFAFSEQSNLSRKLEKTGEFSVWKPDGREVSLKR